MFNYVKKGGAVLLNAPPFFVVGLEVRQPDHKKRGCMKQNKSPLNNGPHCVLWSVLPFPCRFMGVFLSFQTGGAAQV
jgi:hypothetical protein